jgi:heterodisulfide reductase subunit A
MAITEDADERRIGIYVCECGGNIGDVVDVEAVRKEAEAWDGVSVARKESYLCSKPAQDKILGDIERHGLDRVVVASCTPRMHLPTFQDVLKRAGLNPYLLEFVNIREQCSWVHGPHASEEATRKAVSLVRGGYERSVRLEPLEEISEAASRDVLVVGGGIAGITASLELEEQGYRVHLVEREPSIGGQMAKLTKVFPTLDCAQCILTPRIAEAGRRPNLVLHAHSEVVRVEGRPGNFRVEVRRRPRGVDVEACRGCGVCSKVCPVSVPDDFNEGRSARKAAYLPFPQAVPYAYVIDFDSCVRCGRCAEACPSKAIDLEDPGETKSIDVGGIILATGYRQYDAGELKEYGYGVYPDVITMMELERLTSLFGPTGGRVTRFSDGGGAERVAIVLCAGSRDKNQYVPYCSRICCMYSIKQAILLKEMLGIDVWVYYTDVRATGRGYEELYWRAQEAGVVFFRGKVAEVWRNRRSDRLVVRAEDTLTGDVMEEEFDLVSLAVAMVPKLDPVNTLKTGVFACGCALGPKDVRDTVSDSLGAAAKAASFLKEGVVTATPEKAFVDRDACDSCAQCLEACPSNAITLADRATIDPFLCTGCAGCVPECPTGAIDFHNYTRGQIEASLRGLLRDKGEESRLVAFVEKSIGYTGVDFLGLDRAHYPLSVRVVPVPTTALVSLEHILQAFALGADGVLLIEGDHDIDARFTRGRVEEYREQLDDNGVEGMRLYYSLVQLPAYKNAARIFELQASTVDDLGPLEPEELEAVRAMLGG